ncbi:PAS domain-containing protein [Paraburkholderia azotifigens]|uniref:PAS domain-containing protein n=1 Tax=Paraburkholderia azotifigens TaxID=2057004 RepID=UPI0004B8DF89
MLVSATDTTGIITYCNDAFVELSGFSRTELLGQPHSVMRTGLPFVSRSAL